MKTEWIIPLGVLLLILPISGYAEFYKYETEDGRVYYVDDLTKIPPKYRNQLKIYKEKYDHLSETERIRMLEKDRQKAEQAVLEEQRKRRALEKEKYLQSLKTKVVIQDNQILVPVRLGYNGKEIIIPLLLDTGASIIVLHKQFAEALNLVIEQKGLSRMASGKVIQSELTKVDYLKLGPFKMESVSVVVIKHQGPPVKFSGLLGMNFLRNVNYKIDYKNQVIHWIP
ncbi:MAG: aspartyl protease family protein [Desulfobacterales bacterium]